MADYNIALGVKQPEPINYLGQMAQIMGIKAMQDEMQGNDQVRQMFSNGAPEDPTRLLGAGKQGRATYESLLKGKNIQSEVRARDVKMVEDSMKLYKDQLSNLNDPASLAAWAKGVYSVPGVGDVLAKTVPLDTVLASIPTNGDPAAIAEWKRHAALNADKLYNSADAILSSQTSIKTTAMNNATSLATNANTVNATIRGQDLNESQRQWERANPTMHYGETQDGMIGMPTRGPGANVATPVYIKDTPPPAAAPVNNLGTAPSMVRNFMADTSPTASVSIPPPVINQGAFDRSPPAPAAAAATAAPGYTRAVGTKGLTEVQAKSTGFAARAAQAHEILDRVGKAGEVQPGWTKRSLEAVPLIGEGLGTMANFTQSDKEQQVEQAQRNFVNAILRQESGAAVNQSEFDNARKQYFPQPGDEPKVIEQKKQNREMAIKSLEIAAGPGMRKTKGGAADDPLGLR